MRPFLDRFCAETEGARWINVGAGAVAGEMMLTIFPDTVSSTFVLREDQARGLGLPQRSVPIVTLDGVCKDLLGVIPDFVKLDVEGFEYEVLKGSQTLLGKTELILLELTFFGEFEKTKAPHETFAIMADFGYRAYDFTWFQRRPYDRAWANVKSHSLARMGTCDLIWDGSDFAVEMWDLVRHRTGGLPIAGARLTHRSG